MAVEEVWVIGVASDEALRDEHSAPRRDRSARGSHGINERIGIPVPRCILITK